MKTVQLAKNEQAFKVLDDWHGRFESAIRFAYKTQRVETSFGFADVIFTGDSDYVPPTDEPPMPVLKKPEFANASKTSLNMKDNSTKTFFQVSSSFAMES